MERFRKKMKSNPTSESETFKELCEFGPILMKYGTEERFRDLSQLRLVSLTNEEPRLDPTTGSNKGVQKSSDKSNFYTYKG